MNEEAIQLRNRPLRPVPAPAVEPVSLSLDTSDSPGRRTIEACIARKFDDAYNAHLSEFLPELLSLSMEGQPSAVVGLRPAAKHGLFLENYLDNPVEQSISRAFRTPVDRNEIIEIGNLAAAVPGATYALFAILARVLHTAGFRWVVCTATVQVEAMLDRMQFPSKTICYADPTRLGEHAGDWGDYYASRPQVITGDAHVANSMLDATPAMLALADQLADPIRDIAATLRTSINP